MKHTLILAAAILLQSIATHAQWTTDSASNTVVKDDVGTGEITPLQATAENGNTFISWFESSGASYVMKMQLLDVQGNKLWNSDGLLISNHPQSSAVYVYNLATDHDGNAILAFQDTRNVNLETVAYKIDQQGNFIWGNDGIVLHDASADFEVAPAICVLPNNDVIIGWNASMSSAKWITYERINADGSMPWSSYKQIINGAQKFSRPGFAPRSDGTFLMSYINEVGSFPAVSNYIYVNQFDSAGNAIWSNAVEASTHSTTYFDFPKISGDSSNGIIVAFNAGDPNNLTLNDAFIQHIDSSGSLLWTTNGVEISSYANHHRLLGGISFFADSNQVAVALKVLDNAQGQAGVYVQKIDAAGNKLWGANGTEILPLSSNNYHEPFGISLADSGWIVIYTEGGVVTQKLKAMKIDFSANIIWGGTTLSTVASNKFRVTLGTFMNDQLVVAWDDQRNDDGVYAQNISGQGTLGIIATGISKLIPSGTRVYPSLAHNHLMVEVKENSSSSEFQLVDLMGRIKFSTKLHPGINEIDLSSIAPAMYLYHLRANQLMQSGEICKQ